VAIYGARAVWWALMAEADFSLKKWPLGQKLKRALGKAYERRQDPRVE